MFERLQEALSAAVSERIVAPLRRRLPVSGAAGGAVDWIAERLERPTITALKLKFAMDRTDDGQHAVWVYRVDENGEMLIEDVRPLLRFGYREERKMGDNLVINVLSEKDQQTLLALKSLNPQIGEDGELLFDFAPPIFDYVRRKENIVESKRSRQLQISDEPPRPHAVVDYEIDTGVSVQTGYDVPGKEQLIPHEALPRTKDGKYTLLNDTFHPLQEEVDPELRSWLTHGKHHRSLAETPLFFKEMLPELAEVMPVTLTARAERVTIEDEPLHPRARISYRPGLGMRIKTGYCLEDGDELISDEELAKTEDGKYAVFHERFVPLPTIDEPMISRWLSENFHWRPFSQVPTFILEELPKLKAYFDVEQDQAAREVRVALQPLRPTTEIDFNPQHGTEVRAGYRMPEESRIIPQSDMPQTPDGRYALLDDQFVPFPDLDHKSRQWLEDFQTHISLDATPGFFSKHLPLLQKTFDVELTSSANRVRIRKRPLKPTAVIDFDPESGYEIEAGYKLPGEEKLTPSENLQQTSDGQYAILGDQFVPLSPMQSGLGRELLERGRLHVPLRDVPEFFVRDLALIRNDFNAVLTDLARQVNVVDHAFSPMVKVDRKERGWLDFNVGYEINGEFVPHTLFAKTSGDAYQRVGDSTWVRPDTRTVNDAEHRLEKLGADEVAHGYRVPVAQFASLEAFIDAIGGEAELSASYETFIEQLTGFEADENYRLPELTESRLRRQDIKLRPYQRAGIHWLEWLYENHLHGVLADDMGLGKTLQSIMVLRRAYERSRSRQPSLVVCPKSVMTHWEREVHRFFPQMRVERYHGPTRYRLRRRLRNSLQPILLVSTYATVRNDVDQLSKVPFFYLILDEATAIKNPSAKQTKAMKALNAAHRLALSGTPVENRPNELWSMFDFLMRNHLGTQTQFERRFEGPISSGNQRAAEQLARRVRPFLLRRKKEEVARDLPEKIEFDEWCELSAEQRELYGSVQGEAKRMWQALRRGDDVAYPHILSVLQYLKQICDHPAMVTEKWEPLMRRSEKFDWIVDKVDEILRQGEQVAIFSHYLDMLDLLQKVTQRRGWRHIRIDGSTNRRQLLVDKFNRGEAVVALLSLRAAGQGITLTGANHVIHADRWWNPAVEDQATDRVHRIGQNKTVYVYRILVSNTLEERIDELLTEKRGIADRIIGAATEGARRWSRDELIEILRPFE